MEFVVIDVETANADLSSICQVGIANFQQGHLIAGWTSLVNPEDEFDPLNVSIHGIGENEVADAPNWPQLYPEVAARLESQIVVCHTPFDRVAVARACERYGIMNCVCTWLDSAKVVRRAWPQFAKSGYGLSSVASYFEIQYTAHDALEDARCAGEIMIRAISDTGLGVDQWLKRVMQPIGSQSDHAFKRDGNPDGELYNEVAVFTGALSIPRREAAEVAAAAGCRIEDGVTKDTTLLIVGDQDLRRLHGFEKSSKHRKAELLIAKGQPIRILGESDFRTVVMGRH